MSHMTRNDVRIGPLCDNLADDHSLMPDLPFAIIARKALVLWIETFSVTALCDWTCPKAFW
jgi:hypothetical protein